MKELFPQIEKLKIKSSTLSNWFGDRFDEHAKLFMQVSERGRKVTGVLLDNASTVNVQAVPYTTPEPMWTELNIPGFNKLVKKIPTNDETIEK